MAIIEIEEKVLDPERTDLKLIDVLEEWGVNLRDAINAEWPRDTGLSQWQTERVGEDIHVFSPGEYAGEVYKSGDEQVPFMELHAPAIVARVSAATAIKFAEVASNRLIVLSVTRQARG